MTICEFRKKAFFLLKESGIETSAKEVGVMLCHYFDKDLSYFYAHEDAVLEIECEEELMNWVSQRKNRKPLQYITGMQEFMSLDFLVNEHVLIPRQDTEVLVETLITYFENVKEEIQILDMGTGSGCIAVSLAYYLKNVYLTAVDVSKDALLVAKRNAKKHGVHERINFVQSDLFTEIKKREKSHGFDAVVSNPPYISSTEMLALQPEVAKYEPQIALVAPDNGLYFYRKISHEAKGYLKDSGALFLEIGYTQSLSVTELLLENYTDISTIKDLSGNDRVICAKLTEMTSS